MNDKAYVRLVDAHAEGDCRDDYADLVVQEVPQKLFSDALVYL